MENIKILLDDTNQYYCCPDFIGQQVLQRLGKLPMLSIGIIRMSVPDIFMRNEIKDVGAFVVKKTVKFYMENLKVNEQEIDDYFRLIKLVPLSNQKILTLSEIKDVKQIVEENIEKIRYLSEDDERVKDYKLFMKDIVAGIGKK